MRRIFAYGPSLLVLATVALTLLAGPTAVRKLAAARIDAVVTLAQQRLDDDDLLERINQATRDIAAAVEPSVVFIRGVIPGLRSGRGQGQSTGSGWVYDDEGHIVTNAHVVAGAAEVRVQFYDGRVRSASLVGMDRSTDIAVLRVGDSPDVLFPARRANGKPVHQGDRVFAFGSPFGFKFSMSQGIVSGLGRSAQASDGASRYTNFIQTDAAINPGNSGGPLVDVNGSVVGMNTAIITSDERAAQGGAATGISGGISFAIPLETIDSVVSQLLDTGVVLKGFLGVTLGELDPVAAERAGYTRGWGVVIGEVQPGLPADRAGVRPGDIVFAVNGRPTRNMDVLRSIISNQTPGVPVTLSVWRDGEELEIVATLAAARINASGVPIVMDPEGDVEAAIERERRLAEIVEDVSRFGVTQWESAGGGVAIQAVRMGSLAAEAGFRPGQVIVAVDGLRVVDVASLFQSLLQLRERAGDRSLTVVVTVVDPLRRQLELPMTLNGG